MGVSSRINFMRSIIFQFNEFSFLKFLASCESAVDSPGAGIDFIVDFLVELPVHS